MDWTNVSKSLSPKEGFKGYFIMVVIELKVEDSKIIGEIKAVEMNTKWICDATRYLYLIYA